MNGVLFVPPSVLPTVEPLARVAVARGLSVVSAMPVDGPAHYYGGPLCADRLAGSLGIGLLEPPDSWLPSLPRDLVRRRVRSTTMAEARGLSGAAFVKPPSGKDFAARVYLDGADLPGGVPGATAVLVSDVVEFAAEFRLFLLDGVVRTGSRYATWGRLDPAPLEGHPDEGRVRAFAASLPVQTLPSAVVVDVGFVGEPWGEMAVVEANMAWFSQNYQADLDRVLDVVLRAAGPVDAVSAADRGFLRPW